MARYSLFVLKVPLNPKQTNKQLCPPEFFRYAKLQSGFHHQNTALVFYGPGCSSYHRSNSAKALKAKKQKLKCLLPKYYMCLSDTSCELSVNLVMPVCKEDRRSTWL